MCEEASRGAESCCDSSSCLLVVFPDAAGMDSGKQPSSAPGGPEKGPGHREASEEGPPEPRTQEQRHLTGPGKKQSSWAPQEGPEVLQAGQDQAKPGSEPGVLASGVPAAHAGLKQQGSRKETEDELGRQQNPGTVEDQAPESCQRGPECQPTPAHRAAVESDIVKPAEPCCTLDSCGQHLGDEPPVEAGPPHTGALPESSPGGYEDSSQEAMPLMPTATLEEKMADSFPTSMPAPNTPKEGGEVVETQPALGPDPPPEVRNTGERSALDHVQKQPQEPTVATGVQHLGNLQQGFMKCLLDVEEEEAMHRRATKARALPNWKSPWTPTPVPNAAPSLPLTLPQTSASAPAMAPSWAQPPAAGPVPAPLGAPVLASVPVSVLPAPTPDVGWRRTEFLHQSGRRSLTYAKARQEPEGCCSLKLYQSWEERSEEHLTPKQEEAFRRYFEILSGHGEVDARSLENVLLLVGISLMPAQVEDALMSADIDGDGRVGFKDFLAVMTDTKRFLCSVEQNALTDMAPPNPHTLLFEILSLLVEMLALPEAALEEITNYYQKKLKEGTCKAREMESAIGRLQSRKKLPYNLQQADTLEVPERRVLRMLSRLKQQDYAANLQRPYAQVPYIPLCLRLDKRIVRRKQGSHYVLDHRTPTSLGPDIHSLFFQSGSQGNRWVPRGQGPQLRPIHPLPYESPGLTQGESTFPREGTWETVAPGRKKGKGWKEEETNLWEGLHARYIDSLSGYLCLPVPRTQWHILSFS
ncbi:PREDICTED: spermatogenesis-associated protein 21 [Ceratotherium simum simum]|uniref:Spermatogenesis-associated protein 21 n=1 Tax=Ceratotherium simum simum TaxID=73337 RepID=A0ABM1CIL3_CERSS|nr:PREDICTED: spermatogenesis-associated protein 21 [Ceratotherium simum simum]